MSLFITEHEKQAISDIQASLEIAIMFGEKVNVKREALKLVVQAFSSSLINFKQWQQLIKLCETGEIDNIKFAKNLLKTWTDGNL